jgi:hypothetical protein
MQGGGLRQAARNRVLQLNQICAMNASLASQVKNHHNENDGKVQKQVIHGAQKTGGHKMPRKL